MRDQTSLLGGLQIGRAGPSTLTFPPRGFVGVALDGDI